MAKLKISYTKAGLVALEEAGDNTFRKWGVLQEGKYLKQLHSSFKLLSHNPDIGRPANTQNEGFKLWRSGEHYVLYTTTSTNIIIANIIPVKMDLEYMLSKIKYEDNFDKK